MAKVLKITSLTILAICIALGGYLIPPICAQRNDSSIIYGEIIGGSPYATLTADITSPSDGAAVRVGDCFEVIATITATCPIRIGSLFLNKVYASSICSEAAYDVGATLQINGNAQLQGNATQQASAPLYCQDEGCENTVNFSWQVCCTGPGNVTITVTPYGYASAAWSNGVTHRNNVDWLTSPVYAFAPQPLPAENLISDSISITQIPKKTSEISSSWSMPHNIRTINVWAQPQNQLAGQKITIFANLANRGDIEGPYTATLKINGVEEAIKSGMLQGNSAVPLEFMVSRDEPGTYQVDVNGRTTFFTVVEDSSQSEGPSKNKYALLLLWGFLLIALIIVLAILIQQRRQYHS